MKKIHEVGNKSSHFSIKKIAFEKYTVSFLNNVKLTQKNVNGQLIGR